MNIEEYETEYFWKYEAFSSTVRFILEQAIQANGLLPQPQSVQSRAKGIKSLRLRLSEVERLDSQSVEQDRRDLAGVRIIFYTNLDVDRFLSSGLIRNNFDVEEESTKIHHPVPENGETQYRGIHYTVRLGEGRILLPEYAKFVGMRCEIQVQTILNHAWSETSHNIVYKDEIANGFGENAIRNIMHRFERIMVEYLMPAGYEIQKAQQDYERLLQGKELFDQDIPNLLDNAQNNNERYDVLSGLKDHALPHYDDLQSTYNMLRGPLLRAVTTARETEPVPIQTVYGNLEGHSSDAVTKLVVEIIQQLRYINPVGTLELLIEIYRDESSDAIQRLILTAVKRLAEYKINIYDKIGTTLQMALINHIAQGNYLASEELWAIATTVWTEALKTEATSETHEVDSTIFRTAPIPITSLLMEIRQKIISALFQAYDNSDNDSKKREILKALDAATRTPDLVNFSDELLALTLKDAKRIVGFVTEHTALESYELLQHLEHRFHVEYFNAKEIVESTNIGQECRAEAKALMAAICQFRNLVNANDEFVRFKVLVGYESVFMHQWQNLDMDYYSVAEEYRRQEADRYIDEINDKNERDWFALIQRCAQTNSSDGATFIVFLDFISKLSERKPELADGLLESSTDALVNFLICFLNGLSMSNRPDIYARILETELASARNLTGIMRHFEHSEVNNPEFVNRILNRALVISDTAAIIECLIFGLKQIKQLLFCK